MVFLILVMEKAQLFLNKKSLVWFVDSMASYRLQLFSVLLLCMFLHLSAKILNQEFY